MAETVNVDAEDLFIRKVEMEFLNVKSHVQSVCTVYKCMYLQYILGLESSLIIRLCEGSGQRLVSGLGDDDRIMKMLACSSGKQLACGSVINDGSQSVRDNAVVTMRRNQTLLIKRDRGAKIL